MMEEIQPIIIEKRELEYREMSIFLALEGNTSG